MQGVQDTTLASAILDIHSRSESAITMHPRAVSPAASENEFDISKALFQGDNDDGFDFGDGGLVGVPPRPEDIGLGSDDDDAFIAATQAAANRKAPVLKKGAKKSGGFQAMGLNPTLLKAITRKGFSVPTPIQRKTIPLIMDGQDVVGMARTGSGKTAAFVIPMLEKLRSHSAKVGARGIILSPSRELALQTLKVVKEFGKGTDLRTILLVGGDSLEEQFSSMASNPDIIIATPGRFEHLKVEMNLELSSVKYVVFDEADRLFEMGFAAQLAEIMVSLPTNRQTLLFSATLPKSLVEFARAGLQEPKLVRLDAESKISPDLESAFFTVNSSEKEGALLHILQDVIQMPAGQTEKAIEAEREARNPTKKRKRGPEGPAAGESPTKHSTIVFAATKHHVEYLASLLKSFGYAVSYVYGSLDQTARKMQVQDFRSGLTNILVVTDVAARGVDIPILANVINYDFPSQPKIYVHRVGRTARAGKRGWSYSLITNQDLPYLVDLQLFLGRKVVMGRESQGRPNFAEEIVIGSFVRNKLERCTEETEKLLEENEDMQLLKDVARKGEKQYTRTRNSASAESAKRAKTLNESEHLREVNLLFEDDEEAKMEREREKMLARVSGFRPTETVFEIGKRGTANEAADMMRQLRNKVQPRNQVKEDETATRDDEVEDASADGHGALDGDDSDVEFGGAEVDMDEASEDELEITFSQPDSNKKSKTGSGQDSEFFMSYQPQNINMAEDRGYGVHSGAYDKTSGSSNFLEAARGATMDLAMDDSKGLAEASKAKGMRWDKKARKYVARQNDEDGSKGTKMILGESGQKIAASFRSGRFDAWRKANKIDVLPRVGELERNNNLRHGQGRRFKHKQERAPKEADRFRDDYHVRKQRVQEAREKRVGRFAEGKGKTELKGVDDVRKERKLAQHKKEKNARAPKKRH
ncbi:ATP-dependent RNA helicase dbp10 [Zalaria obscura]|uniref:ATP-dependent RNA helicase dbp10 n=1 Tax=Zalaria obscura TaxID=2024903 RepID=A0ACC3SEV0_9PEZI